MKDSYFLVIVSEAYLAKKSPTSFDSLILILILSKIYVFVLF